MNTVLGYFIKSALRHKNKIAVIHDGISITYNELHQRSLYYSELITDNNVKPGDRVAIFSKNSIDYIACYYGIWLSSAVAVPLNTDSKAKDIANWVKHADAKLIFMDKTINESDNVYQLVSEDCNIKYIDHEDERGYGKDIMLDEYTEPDINSLASIIYTSGTTGQPKGVMLTHKNISSNMQSILSYLPIKDDDKFVNVLPFFYSYGNSVLHTHLMCGATIILVNSLMFPNKVLETIDGYNATSISGVPSTFLLLLGKGSLERYDLSSLKYLTQAGGPMAPSTTKQIINKIPDVEIYIMYGQTEATARLSYLPPELIGDKMSSIGKPIPGVEFLLKKDNGELADVGDEGVIHARGDNIMSGYWKDEMLTKSVICNGWLNTGDIARQDSDGLFYIVGRKTEMIKTAANRVSPKEIEEVLLTLPGVNEVAVVGVDDELLGQ
ncbi:MAG: acyl--CoA ligase, partial [Gammaproteobacteria bacterium]|nr:acyl--CoA ligase [Gammaproteobacteria bacterium]